MSWLRSLLGNGRKGPKVTAHDKAILDLKRQRDKIKQFQKRIAGVSEREKAAARECLKKGNKEKALLLLRRKKLEQQQLVKTDAQLATLEDLVSSIEFAQIQKDVIIGLQQGNEVLKELNKSVSLETVERLMDESSDGITYQQQVSDMLAERISHEDEAEVQDELEALENEVNGVKQPEFPTVPDSARLHELSKTPHHITEEEFEPPARLEAA